MSFKTHSLLLRPALFIYFFSVRLQGQFPPTADERSIQDLNLKSQGPGEGAGGGRGGSVAGARCNHEKGGGCEVSLGAKHRPISL